MTQEDDNANSEKVYWLEFKLQNITSLRKPKWIKITKNEILVLFLDTKIGVFLFLFLI